jgi:hypothetical protein
MFARVPGAIGHPGLFHRVFLLGALSGVVVISGESPELKKPIRYLTHGNLRQEGFEASEDLLGGTQL